MLRAAVLTAAAIVLPSAAHAQIAPSPVPADRPMARSDENSRLAHQQLVEKARRGGIDIYFEGDSIVRRWGATDYPELLANWTQNFFGWNAADFGWGADTTQNILWRLDHQELDGVQPKIIVLLAGTNNVGTQVAADSESAAAADDIARGIKAILDAMRAKAPAATIILTAVFPRNDRMALMPIIDDINRRLSSFADGRSIRLLNINDKLSDASGRLYDGMMNAQDKLHPTLRAYQAWADALKPIFTELIGPPAKDDHAPPPTGNPAAR